MTHIQTTELVHGIKRIVISLSMMALVGCGAGKTIVTVDDSADYKSAESLPPLKKPSRVLSAPEPEPTQEPEPVVVAQDIPEASRQSNESNAVPKIDVEVIETPATVETTASDYETVDVPLNDDASISASARSLPAKVIAVGSGQNRLQIEGGFEQAWAFLSANLQKSDVTVFSRNKAAGRFSIGCGEIETAPTVVKKGGWSFFNRAKQKRLEYCALQAIEKRGVTVVSVLNRAGAEVAGDYSNRVFSRVLNN